jgi:hypothetical protein
MCQVVARHFERIFCLLAGEKFNNVEFENSMVLHVAWSSEIIFRIVFGRK